MNRYTMIAMAVDKDDKDETAPSDIDELGGSIQEASVKSDCNQDRKRFKWMTDHKGNDFLRSSNGDMNTNDDTDNDRQ